MNQSLYAHINNKRKMEKKKKQGCTKTTMGAQQPYQGQQLVTKKYSTSQKLVPKESSGPPRILKAKL
jgi:hypothetical protein